MKHTDIQKLGLEDLLLVFRRSIYENIKKEGFKHDLTFSQVEVIRFIGLQGKKTMREIANHLKITPPSATELISNMEQRGLIKKEKDIHDKRIVRIVLSEVSKNFFNSVSKSKNTIFKKMTSRLNAADTKNLERIIKILIKE